MRFLGRQIRVTNKVIHKKCDLSTAIYRPNLGLEKIKQTGGYSAKDALENLILGGSWCPKT